MDFAELYGPFRRRVRKFGLVNALAVIHAWSQHDQFNQPLPQWIQLPAQPLTLSTRIHPWELELLAKELILNSEHSGTRELFEWHEFATLTNALRKLEGEIYTGTPDAREHVLHEMFRIAHRQFHWQNPPSQASLTRAFRIFGRGKVGEIVGARLGMDPKMLYLVGFALTGHFLDSVSVRLPVDVNVPTLTSNDVQRFLALFAIDIDALKNKMLEAQRCNEDFVYAFNPLRKWPLVTGIRGAIDRAFSPIPTLLINRYSDGIYYDICDHPQFANAFGNAFQAYVGDFAKAAGEHSWLVLEECPYTVRKNSKRTIDWIVRDGDADLFIECKGKRVTLEARTSFVSRSALEDDIATLAKCVVQAYSTLNDALAGHYPHWTKRDASLFLFIATLEDWHLMNPQAVDYLHEKIEVALRSKDLPTELLQRFPYTVCGMDDFELAIQVMAKIGISRFMTLKTADLHRNWNMRGFIETHFASELRSIDAPPLTSAVDEFLPPEVVEQARRISEAERAIT